MSLEEHHVRFTKKQISKLGVPKPVKSLINQLKYKTMERIIYCEYIYKEDRVGLERPPYPGEIGEKDL